MKGTLKQAMHRPYADQQIISVEVPEWPDDDGNPVTIRFATELNVDQVASVQAAQLNKGLKGLPITLFRLCALGEDDAPLVDPNDDILFRTGVNALTIAAVVERSGLEDVILPQLRREKGEPAAKGK